MPVPSSLFQRVGGAFTPSASSIQSPTQVSQTPQVQEPPTTVDPASTNTVSANGQSGPSSAVDLALLEQAIAEVEQIAPQAVPTAMLQTVAAAQAAQATQGSVRSGSKETLVTTAPVESGQSVQYVEYEPNPELPPEVEGYLDRVEQHADEAPQEIVIADTAQPMPTAHQLPSQPVMVLPITPEVEQAGLKKSPKFSVRWLVEWSRKIMKAFVGKVIYRSAS